MTPLLFPDAPLSLAELCAARLDGHLVELGEGFSAAEQPDTAWFRAQSLRPLLGGDDAIVALGAAWIHGALWQPPSPVELRRVSAVRRRRTRPPLVIHHDTRLPLEHTEAFGSVRVSSRARTALDLARHPEPARHRVAVLLCAAHPGTAEAARELARTVPRLHGRARAHLVLACYEEVTR